MARGALARFVLLVCGASVSSPVRAAPAPLTDDLPALALPHLKKALELHDARAYADAEEEFRRIGFYAPNWRPLHYNLAIVLEAQGSLGQAIREYREARPHMDPEVQRRIDQRIFELDARRGKIRTNYRRELGTGAAFVTLGVLTLAGAGVLIGIGIAGARKKSRLTAERDALTAMAMPDPEESMRVDELNEEIREQSTLNTSVASAAVLIALLGAGMFVASSFSLQRARRLKGQLDGVALGPTRLRWAGASMVLRF